MSLNSFCVRVYNNGIKIIDIGPLPLEDAIIKHEENIRMYGIGFDCGNDRKILLGHFNLRIYTNAWIIDNIKFWKSMGKDDDFIAQQITDIGQVYHFGHMRFELFHFSKLDDKEIKFQNNVTSEDNLEELLEE